MTELEKELKRTLELWMKYAETNYSGDGMDAVHETKKLWIINKWQPTWNTMI
jgi:hypothetical protein